MLEQNRSERETQGPGGLGNPFGGSAQPATATVSHGPYVEQLPVGGMSVGEVRRRFGDRMDIDPASTAVLNGNVADEDAIVEEGQILVFARRAGEKGVCVCGRHSH